MATKLSSCQLVCMSSCVSSYCNLILVTLNTTSEEEVKTSVGQPTTLQEDNQYETIIQQVVLS